MWQSFSWTFFGFVNSNFNGFERQKPVWDQNKGLQTLHREIGQLSNVLFELLLIPFFVCFAHYLQDFLLPSSPQFFQDGFDVRIWNWMVNGCMVHLTHDVTWSFTIVKKYLCLGQFYLGSLIQFKIVTSSVNRIAG